MKEKLINNIQIFLESKDGLKKSWFRTTMIVLLATIMVSIVLGLSINYGPNGSNFNLSQAISIGLNNNIELSIVARDMAIAVLVIAFFPHICLFATWIIGINQTSKSKYFHLFMWCFAFIAILLALVALIIFIRACVFNNDTYFK